MGGCLPSRARVAVDDVYRVPRQQEDEEPRYKPDEPERRARTLHRRRLTRANQWRRRQQATFTQMDRKALHALHQRDEMAVRDLLHSREENTAALASDMPAPDIFPGGVMPPPGLFDFG